MIKNRRPRGGAREGAGRPRDDPKTTKGKMSLSLPQEVKEAYEKASRETRKEAREKATEALREVLEIDQLTD